MLIPNSVLSCIDRLEQAGFAAYVVGGCVRDHCLGLTPADYDMCTAALPEETEAIFADCRLVLAGKKHGTVCLYLALRMVCRYQLWSADPQLQHYAFYLGAHVAVMLGCYQQTALDAGSGDRRSLWRWCLAAVYLCLTALPGSEDPFFLLCCGIWMFSNLNGTATGKGD